jgi:hypothetical protein
MFSLTDYQLRIVMDIAVRLDPDRRSVYLERCAAMLKFRHRFSDPMWRGWRCAVLSRRPIARRSRPLVS